MTGAAAGLGLLALGFALNLLLYARRVPTFGMLAGDALALLGAGVAAAALPEAWSRGHAAAVTACAVVTVLAAAYPLAWHVRIQVPAGGLRVRPGDALPPFTLRDPEEDAPRDVRSWLGPRGALLVFYRGFF